MGKFDFCKVILPGMVDLYWKEFLVRSTSMGKSLASFMSAAHSVWKVVRPCMSRRS